MSVYSQPSVAKVLAAKIVQLKLKLGLIRVTNRREYRQAVVNAAHSAYISL